MNKKRAINEQDKINFSKGKKFNSEYQPTPEAKSEGKKKANFEKKVLETAAEMLMRNLAIEQTNIKGETKTIKEIGLINLLKDFAKGDKKAIELVLKLTGEFVDKQEISGISPTSVVINREMVNVESYN